MKTKTKVNKAKRRFKPKRKQPNSGLYWHVHHEKAVEFCYGYRERLNYIKTEKSMTEQPLRLKLFKPVTLAGATGDLRKAIKACVGAPGEWAAEERIKEFGYYSMNSLCNEVYRELHRSQCNPRCPCRSSSSKDINMLRYRNNTGDYVLAPKDE